MNIKTFAIILQIIGDYSPNNFHKEEELFTT
jgi:hypothetical protein